MNIEHKITLTESEVKSAIVRYLHNNYLKPNSDIRLIFKNGESVEQVLFTDLEILWTASSAFFDDKSTMPDDSHIR